MSLRTLATTTVLALILAGVAGVVAIGRPSSAAACSLKPWHDPIRSASGVVQGRIVAMSDALPSTFEPAENYRTVTIEIYQKFQNSPLPPRLDVILQVNDETSPCYQVDPERLNGRALVVALKQVAPRMLGATGTSMWFEDESYEQYPGQWRLAKLVRPDVQVPFIPIEMPMFLASDMLGAPSDSGSGLTIAEDWRALEVYAGGEKCTYWDLSARDSIGRAFTTIGLPDQPLPCRTENSLVCVQLAEADRLGRKVLSLGFYVQPYRPAYIRMVDLEPAGADCAGQTYQAPAPPSVGTGLAPSDGHEPGMLVCVALAGVLLAMRRRGIAGRAE